MKNRVPLPPELEATKAAARRAIGAIRPAQVSTSDQATLYTAGRTAAGHALPPYYLVYFLLVELLEFPFWGRFEKVAWSVPIEFDGDLFSIEHRKLGLGVFAPNPSSKEEQAKEIVKLVGKGVRTAAPFFAWLAERAVQESKLNVVNRSDSLFGRFEYLLGLYKRTTTEAEERTDERHTETQETPYGTMTTTSYPAWELRQNAEWLALAAIEAFFSWTEHVFIHIAILSGNILREAKSPRWPRAVGTPSSRAPWTCRSRRPRPSSTSSSQSVASSGISRHMALLAKKEKPSAFTQAPAPCLSDLPIRLGIPGFR